MKTETIRSIARIQIEKRAETTGNGYQRIVRIASSMANAALARQTWRSMPTHRGGARIDVTDRNAFVAQIESIDSGIDEFGFRCNITNSSSDREWREAGRTIIRFDPYGGLVSLEVYRPMEAFEGEASSVLQAMIQAVVSVEEPHHAGMEIFAARGSDASTLRRYMDELQLFPHRRAIGWMGFVPHPLGPRELPEAARLIPVDGKGTIIVSVDEPFDLFNDAHLAKAHAVEARLAMLGMLPVTDQSLL